MADNNEVSKILSDCIEKSGFSLFKVACEMWELLGSEISKTQIDSWINNKTRFPAK